MNTSKIEKVILAAMQKDVNRESGRAFRWRIHQLLRLGCKQYSHRGTDNAERERMVGVIVKLRTDNEI